jgi:Xaa-Pro aminopeptidase
MTFDRKAAPAAPSTASAAAAPASHDTTPPPALLKFMVQGWAPPQPVVVEPYEHAASTRARRARVSRRYPGEVLVVASGNLKVRSNDEHYPFRACSDFAYLTGHLEPDSVLVMLPVASDSAGGDHRAVLFVDPNPGKVDATFFTDRIKGELWEGPCLGVPAAAERYGIDDTRPLSELRAFVDEHVAPAGKLRVLRGHAAELERWILDETRDARPAEQADLDRDFGVFLSELRLIKDAGEILELRRAIAATRRGFEDVIRSLRTARSERELENAFYCRARLDGNGTGYQTIVAAGAHACTLHWRKNNGAVRPGELLLLDAGVENRALYTADITRVLPVSGTFGPEQREIYELVLAAQRAAFEAVAPGNDFMEPNRRAMSVLAHGLERLGLLPCSAEEALKDDHQFTKRYSLHNVSHMLGLDVHDCARARAEVYKYGPLLPGMVLTIEPGLYFQPDDLTVPERYRGIGVRIEDDLLVTETGFDNLSAELPTAPEAVERWMAEVWASA